jgi:hypothetical protein
MIWELLIIAVISVLLLMMLKQWEILFVLTVIALIALAFSPWIIWFGLWWYHGFPSLFDGWNPWNISLLVIIAVYTFGGGSSAASK